MYSYVFRLLRGQLGQGHASQRVLTPRTGGWRQREKEEGQKEEEGEDQDQEERRC